MMDLHRRAAGYSTEGRRAASDGAFLVVQLASGAELYAIAQGGGDERHGADRSRRALDVLQAALEDGATLSSAVRETDITLYQESLEDPELKGMGTTLVAGMRQGDEYTIVSVGNVRAYRLDRLGITQVTRDGASRTNAPQSGQRLPRKPAAPTRRQQAGGGLGSGHEIQLETYGPYDATEPHTLLLCTNGVHRFLSSKGMRDSIRTARSAEWAAANVARAAYDAGSDKSISVVVISFGSDAWRLPPRTQAEHPLAVYDRDGQKISSKVIVGVILGVVIAIIIFRLLT